MFRCTPRWIRTPSVGGQLSLAINFVGIPLYNDDRIRNLWMPAADQLASPYLSAAGRARRTHLGKLDGRIDTAFFELAEWRAEQDRLFRDVATHQAADQNYIEKADQLLQLAYRANDLFERRGTNRLSPRPEEEENGSCQFLCLVIRSDSNENVLKGRERDEPQYLQHLFSRTYACRIGRLLQ
jgi:hypothetical protein